ncbi:MAG: FAD-dependent oxidoreductase [Anaerolineae bacterium]
MNIVFERSHLPILADCDVAVIGGGFGGVATALALTRAGRTVALVEPRTYLGREVGATLRPWLPAPEEGVASLPSLIAACIGAGEMSAQEGEIPLHMDAVKLTLENMVLEAGVKLIYASLPVGVSVADGRIQGVIIGNKSGRQVIKAETVIDATATALVAQLAGAEFEPPLDDAACFSCTLEFTGVAAPDVWGADEAELAVPERLGLVGDKVILHRGYRGADHVLLEYQLDLPTGERGPLAASQRDAQARRRSMALAEYLVSEVTAFDAAYLATSSYELDGPQTTRMAGSTPPWAQELAAVALDVGWDVGGTEATLAELAGPVGGLWCLNEAARLSPAMRSLLRDPIVAADLGELLAQAVDHHWASWGSGVSGDLRIPSAHAEPLPAPCGLQIKEQAQPQEGRGYKPFSVEPSPVPVLCAADLVVAGGGTSGAVAGIVAGQEGLRTIVVDMNPGLGGTGTYGGIYTYWFGRQVGFVEHVLDWVGDVQERLHLVRPEGTMARWNIEAKTWALAEQAEAAGVQLLLNACVVAAIVENVAGRSSVGGVVVATRWGPMALLCDVVIDATGDGDVAAFAGADHVYGSEREHVVMYAYLPQVASPGRPRNVKTSMADTTNIEDYVRMLLAERRRGLPGDHDHGVYIGPRESRHIRGDLVLTFTDQLLLRGFSDVVFIAFSNHDMKGESTSDWIRMGLQAPNLEIEIPYRALIPRGLDDILVVGKAYSATHDALAGPRMMPDLENLGGVAAIAAAIAIRSGEPVREIKVRALQERLVVEGALPERVLTRTLVPLEWSDEDLVAMIDGLDPAKPLQTYSDADVGEHQEGRVPLVDIMCAGPRVIPPLEQALATAKDQGDRPRQVLLARILAMLASKAGVEVLVSMLQEEFARGELPGRDVQIRHAGRHPPNQGAAPDAANLLYCLGMARDTRIIPVWRRTVELLEGASEEEILDPVKAWYYYVSYLAYGAERLGDPASIPILSRLHSYPPFHNRMVRSGFEPDHLPERLAYLEILIGRALARCGSPEGYFVLINYLDDVRTLLAEHAHAELVAITGHDWGKDIAAWSAWLEREGGALKPVAWTGPTEPVAAWGEDILIERNDVNRKTKQSLPSRVE